MNCPSCAGELDWDQRFAHLVVCPYCSSSIVVDEQALRVAGKMNVLAVPAGPLFVGGTGRLGKHTFRVAGRVRYGYGRGVWDEWYLLLDDDTTAWISQDEGGYTFERLRSDASPSAELLAARPGAQVQLGGAQFQVNERDEATCEGGEGQLPFDLEVGHRIAYLDLSSGDRVATVEIEEDGARVFVGRPVPPSSIVMDRTAEEAGVAAPQVAGGGGAFRDRVVRDTGRAVNLKCIACAHPLPEVTSGEQTVACSACGNVADLSDPRVDCAGCGEAIPVYGGDQAASVVCRFCHAHQSLESGVPQLLEILKERKRAGPRCALELGARGTLRGVQQQVVGHLRFEERDEGESYWSDEFLLHSREHGYAWLICENGHFGLAHEVSGVPPVSLSLSTKANFTALGRKWRFFEKGRTRVAWVDGELPWVAQLGDENGYADLIDPPFMLSGEFSETEAEWFQVEFVPRDEIATAFGVKPAELPRPIGVAPHQPYERAEWSRAAGRVMSVFAVLLLLLLVFDGFTGGRDVQTYAFDAPGNLEGEMTKPFEVTQSDAICELEFSSDVNNAWLSIAGAVVDAEDRVILEFSSNLSYYHGVEGGESWSEGSRSDTKVFKLKSPGLYRLLLDGESGSGETADSRGGPQLSVVVREDLVLTRFYLILFVLCCLWVAVGALSKLLFEGRRWAPVMEE